jgi:filamentous hemagglutinin family protein
MRNLFFFISLSFLSLGDLFSLPEGSRVESGNALITQTGSNVKQVTVGSDLAVINWDSYSIGLGERVVYTRSGSTTFAVLNNVTGPSSSTIAGSLTADNNGAIYLVNPQGIMISSTGVILTGGFVASTLLLTSDFNPAYDMTFGGNSIECVTNQGTIIALAGDAILIGFRTVNTGSMQAANLAGIAAGTEVLLKPVGLADRLYISTIVDATSEETGIENYGTLTGLNLSLKADGNAYALAINQRGVIQATGCNNTNNGEIFLVANPGNHPNGIVEVAGSIVRASDSTAGVGPDITILGYQVAIEPNTVINASGDFGGGDITIGALNAGIDNITTNNVYIDSSAKIITNGITTGSGGIISYYGTSSALNLGTLSAKGGAFAGNGGMVEGISPAYNAFEATVDLTASHGITGRTTLHSSNFLISAESNHGPYFQPSSYTSSNIPSVITTAALENTLNNSNLSVVVIDGGCSGDITVVNPFTWSTPNNLTLNASNSIRVNSYAIANGISLPGREILRLEGGNLFIGSSDFSKGVNTGFHLKSGSIVARATNTLGIYGGSTDNAIGHLTTLKGNLDVNYGKTFDLKSGPNSGANALVKATNINIDCLSGSSGDLNVIGNDCSKALIDATNGTINIGSFYRPQNIYITAGCCSSDDYALIGSPTGFVTINSAISGDYVITGGASGMNNIAGFISSSGSGNDFFITGRNLLMFGGSGSSASGNSAIIKNFGSGNVTIRTLSDLLLKGGEDGATGCSADIRGNKVLVSAGRDILLHSGTGILDSTLIYGLNGLRINVGRDLDVHGGGQIGSSATILVDNGLLAIENVGSVAGKLDLASSVTGVNNSNSVIRIAGEGELSIGREHPFKDINISAGGVGSSSEAVIELIHKGVLIVHALHDINITGGQDGDQTFAGIINRGIGSNRVIAGHDINITTGNNQAAEAFIKALGGAVHVLGERDVNLTGSCSIPNVASIATFGDNSNLNVHSGRDIILKEKSILELQGSRRFNVSAGNRLLILNCSQIIGSPNNNINPVNYYPPDGVYELFYRLNTFVYPDWYLLSSDDFWTRTNYTSPR